MTYMDVVDIMQTAAIVIAFCFMYVGNKNIWVKMSKVDDRVLRVEEILVKFLEK